MNEENPIQIENTYLLIAGKKQTEFSSAKEAGAAFYNADRTKRPAVIHTIKQGEREQGRFMANTGIHGTYENGETKYVKELPYSHDQDKDFRDGFLEALKKKVEKQQKNIEFAKEGKNSKEASVNMNHLKSDIDYLEGTGGNQKIDQAEALTRAEKQRALDRNWLENNSTTERNKPINSNAEQLPNQGQEQTVTAQEEQEIKNHNQPKISAAEEEKQRELIERVQKQFHVNGEKYHFKDKPDKVAFIDHGKRMATSYNDERIATSLVMLAEAKGWKSLKVKGHSDFRREVWLAASMQGLEVHGYKPTEQDLFNLDQYQQRTMQNSVEKGEPSRSQDRTQQPEKQDTKLETANKTPSKITTGRLLEHGEAKYKHDPDEKQSYYVKLETDVGEKTIWGIDLKRSIVESTVQVGDSISVQYMGSKPVDVESIKRDKTGKVIGKEIINTKRNTWDIQRTDKEKVVKAVAAAVIKTKTKNPAQVAALQAAIDKRLSERSKAGKVPTVPIYDNKAASKSKTNERMPKTRVQERAQEQAR